jgi:hypothetical protein
MIPWSSSRLFRSHGLGTQRRTWPRLQFLATYCKPCHRGHDPLLITSNKLQWTHCIRNWRQSKTCTQPWTTPERSPTANLPSPDAVQSGPKALTPWRLETLGELEDQSEAMGPSSPCAMLCFCSHAQGLLCNEASNTAPPAPRPMAPWPTHSYDSSGPSLHPMDAIQFQAVKLFSMNYSLKILGQREKKWKKIVIMHR